MVVTRDIILKVARDFGLPLGLVVQKTAILARSGAGKTNASVVIVEELLDRGQQTVILDPPGAWWGLKSSADGNLEGHSILIFGGEHQDVPLRPDDGERVARLLVETRFSAILDLSEFTGSELTKFVEAFARALYDLKGPQVARSPMLLVTEEADEMAPQVPQQDQRKMLGAMERIAKRGRMRGIGLLAVTQRSASLNKNVLSQIEVLIAMQTTDPRDIDAIDAWLKRQPDQEARRQLLGNIASLRQGEAYVWSPSWLSIFRKIHFRKRLTYDSSATPDPMVEIATGPKRLATVGDMLSRITPYIEEIREQPHGSIDSNGMVMTLRADLAAAHAEIAALRARPDPEIRYERVLLLDEPSTQQLQDMLHRYTEATADLSGALARATVHSLLGENGAKPQSLALDPNIPSNSLQFSPSGETLPKSKTETEKTEKTPPLRKDRFVVGENAPTRRPQPMRAERILLTSLFLFPEGRTRSQLSLLTGYSARSSTFANAVSGLRVRGYLEDIAEGEYRITETGRLYIEVNGQDSPPPGTYTELFDRWSAKMHRAERTIFMLIATHDARAEGIARDEVSDQSGYSASSSTFNNALSALRTRDLIQGSKTLRLSDTVLSLVRL